MVGDKQGHKTAGCLERGTLILNQFPEPLKKDNKKLVFLGQFNVGAVMNWDERINYV